MNGIDVSTFQGDIDWNKASSSVDFVMIKATQGRGEGASTKHLRVFTDSKLERNLLGAAALGIPIGVYHYFTAMNTEEAEYEADYYLRTIMPYKAQISLWAAVDVEYAPSLSEISKSVLTASVRRFNERVFEAGFMPMLYTNPDFLENRFIHDAFDDTPIWLAHWGVEQPLSLPTLKIWQYGVGKLNGISGEVDLNKGCFDLPQSVEKRLSIGDAYTLKADDCYTNGKSIPRRLIGREFKVSLIRDGRILLGEINSWIKRPCLS